jgi:hypothetical protein
MKAYAITRNTATTGLIEEIEGQVHESTSDVFMVKRDGELNQYYRTWKNGDVFPDGSVGSIEGYWFYDHQSAVTAANQIRNADIRELSFQIKLLRALKFQ